MEALVMCFHAAFKKWLAFTTDYQTDNELDHFCTTEPNHLWKFSSVQQQENYYSILRQNSCKNQFFPDYHNFTVKLM